MKVAFLGLIVLLVFSPVSAREGVGTVTGVVRNLDGTPISEAVVYAVDYTDLRRRVHTTTDENGRFVLRDVPAGTISIHAYKESEGYADTFFSFFTISKKAWQTVKVEDGHTTDGVTLELARYATLKLSIRNEQGEPVGASLVFTRADNPQQPYSVGSDLSGNTAMLVPPTPFRLQIQADGYEVWRYEVSAGGKRSSLLRLRAGETFELTVRLKRAH